MKFQKVLSGLNDTPSQIKSNLKNVKPAGYDMNIDELLNYASQKLRPVIDFLMKRPQKSKLFIDIMDWNIIEQTTQIIQVIGTTLETVGFQTNIRHVNFNMQKYWKNVYPNGRVHVDATLLLAVLELNSLLENIRAELDAFQSSPGSPSLGHTESELPSVTNTEFNYNPNKNVFQSIPSPETKSSLTVLSNEFVLPHQIKNIPSSTSEYQMLREITEEDNNPARKAISNTSFDGEKISRVTDIDEARNILFKCIYDLKAVSEYLGVPRKDAFTQHKLARHEVENHQEDATLKLIGPKISSSKEPLILSNHQLVKEEPPFTPPPSPSEERNSIDSKTIKEENISRQSSILRDEDNQICYCSECCSADGPEPGVLGESKNDHVIICIKNCNEDEEDIQIVIRQCPEYKSSSAAREHQHMQKPSDSPQKNIIPQYFKLQETRRASQKSQESKDPHEKSSITPELSVDAPVEESKEMPKDEPPYFYGEEVDDAESTVLYNKDSKENNAVHSDEEGPQKEKLKKQVPSIEPTQVWKFSDDLRIKYFETRNLYLKTQTGEELVISLTVTPKDLDGGGGAPSLNMSDIFNNSDDLKDRGSTSETSSPKTQDKIISYYIPDKYIPLGRTKICSSLDFDVSTQHSKIRDGDIKNKNNKIVVQLQHFGTDNLLRACRPAKCCRKSVLNEKMKKHLPYSPSIRSLPLDDDDMSVISESLQMRLQKVKNSTDLSKEYRKDQKDLANPISEVLYFFVKGRFLQKRLKETCKRLLMRRKLDYYINLVNDVSPNNSLSREKFYFSIEESKNLISHQRSEAQFAKLISSPTRRIKEKYTNLDKKAGSTVQKLLFSEKALWTRNVRKSLEMNKKLSEGNNTNLTKSSKTSRPRKLHIHGKQRKEVTIKELVWLKRNASDDNTATDIGSDTISTLESHESPVKLKSNIAAQSLGICSSRFRKKNSSRSSMFNVTRKTRRKKREFYLSRSLSEISLSALAHLSKNNVPKNMRKVRTKTATNSRKMKNKKLLIFSEERATKLFSDINAAKIILGRFSKVFFEMIITEMELKNLDNKKTKNTNENTRRMSFAIEPTIGSIHELYVEKTFNKHNFGTKPSCIFSTKSSQCCMAQSKEIATDICTVDTYALQPSIISADSKIGQISSAFKNIYHFEDQYQSSSGAKIDAITVKSKSNESMNLSVLQNTQDSASESLLRLKETSKKYKHVEKIVADKNSKDPPIRPIEYLVYHQVSERSDKSEKKPSLMQKILTKTKGLFGSPEKDIDKNQIAINSLTEADTGVCRNCGCSIEKCAPMTSAAQQLAGSCPKDIKPNTEANKASCKKHNSKSSTSTCGNLSKFTSSSVLSIKARFKRSNSTSPKESKRKLAECNWVDADIIRKASDKNANVVPELNPDDNIMVTKCNMKNVAVGTTTDSFIQKCFCEKCKNFIENEICCCSLCLRCQNKSFEAKPVNQNVGITTGEQSTDAQIIKSEPDKGDETKIFQSSLKQSEENSSNNLPEDAGSIKENTESIHTRKVEKGNCKCITSLTPAIGISLSTTYSTCCIVSKQKSQIMFK